MYNDTGASEAIPHVQVPAGSKCSRLGLYKRQKMREKEEISAKKSSRGQMPCPRPSQENNLLKNEGKRGKMRDRRAKNCPRLGLYKRMDLLENEGKRKK